jgi:hypothetical protein
VRLDQHVGVPVVDVAASVADLAHADLLIHPASRISELPVCRPLVQLDDGHTCLRGQLLEPLGHVVGVPRPPIGLAEDQVVILPGGACRHPCLDLGLAVLAQQFGRIVVEEHLPIARLRLRGRLLVQLPAELQDGALHDKHAPVKVGEGPPEPAQFGPAAAAQLGAGPAGGGQEIRTGRAVRGDRR